MEAQITAGTHSGPGLDVPEQGLHLRRAHDSWHGVLDTSMGPVGVDIHGDHVPHADDVATDEEVLAIPEQFVALTLDGGVMTGGIATAAGTIPFRRATGGEAADR